MIYICTLAGTPPSVLSAEVIFLTFRDAATISLMLISVAAMYLIHTTAEFQSYRYIIGMAGPYLGVSLLAQIVKFIAPDFYKSINLFVEGFVLITFVWGWANWSSMRKQQKALEEERKKRETEQENNRLISAQRDELEYLVSERDSRADQTERRTSART